MHFLFPMMLLGALGIGVPIVIHLFNRFRFKEVAWGAMELLRRAVIIRKRKIRIEDLILLALRCLVIILLALALSRPIITPHGVPWLGRTSSVSVVIALDASFSMAHKPGVRARFERALDRVRDIAKTLKPGNPVSLVLCGDRPRFLMRNEGYDADRFEAQLKSLKPLPERLNLDLCLGEITASNFIDEVRAPLLEFYIVSDAQENSFKPLSEKTREALKQMGEVGKVYFLPAKSENADNLAIIRLDLKGGLARKGVSSVDVEIANFANPESGRGPRSTVVRLLVNDVEVDKDFVSIAAGDKHVSTLYARIDESGPNRITARLEADELEIDNSRYAVLDVLDRTRVLLVQSELGAAKEDKDFIATALLPLTSEYFVVDRATRLDTIKQLSDYQLIILSNVVDVTADEVRRLDFFVRSGGGLLMFLGSNTQPELMNLRFTVDDVPLLPGKLTSVVRPAALKTAGGGPDSPKEGVPVAAVEHPLSKWIGSKLFMDPARVYGYVKMELYPGAREVLKTSREGDPILAEKSLGLGKVIVFTSSPERAWTNMVSDPPVVPVLIFQTPSFVTRHDWSIGVSDDLVVPLPPDDKGKKVVFRLLPEESSRPTTRDSEVQGGVVYARLPNVPQPGFYEIVPEGRAKPLVAAVNVDTRESNVQTLSATALSELFDGLPVRVLAESEAFETSLHLSRVGRELWRDLLIALLCLLVVEGLFARWITMRTGPVE